MQPGDVISSESLLRYVVCWKKGDVHDRTVRPLHAAAARSDKHAVHFIHGLMGHDVNIRDSRQRTPLHYAAIVTNSQNIRALWKLGADVDAVDHKGRTPMYFAVKKGARRVIELLVCLNSRAPSMRTNKGRTLLMCLQKSQYASSSELFQLVHGLSPDTIDAVDKRGWTALHHGLTTSDAKIVKLFHDAGSKALEVKDVQGITPMHVAATYGCISAIRELYKCGCDLDVQCNNGGATPMHYATFQRFPVSRRVFETLIELGSRAYWMPCNHGNTPRDLLDDEAAQMDEFIASRSVLETLRMAAIIHRQPKTCRRLAAE